VLNTRSMADQPKPRPDETALVPEGGTLVPQEKKTPGQLAADQRVKDLKRRIAMAEENDVRIVTGIQRFKDIPGPLEPGYAEVIRVLNEGTADELASWGFPGGIARGRKALRLALWGQRPKKDAPYGIVSANERFQARQKIAGKTAGRSSTFNLVMSIPAPRQPTQEDRVVIVQPPSKEEK
jgi:hypothetical protein